MAEEKGDTPSPSILTSGNLLWRMILDREHSAAWNMAIDEAILDAVNAGIVPPTIRLYRWSETTVSVGRFQDVSRTVDLETCRDLDIPIIRRPTGGRGILHGGDQTISICIPVVNLGPAGSSVQRSYTVLVEGFRRALVRLEVDTLPGESRSSAGRSGDCFAWHSSADLITTSGSKILGSAQLRRGGSILQQSSLRHFPQDVTPAHVFRGPAGPEDYPLRDVEDDLLAAALVEGFREALGPMIPGSVTGWEEERACVLQASVRCADPKK